MTFGDIVKMVEKNPGLTDKEINLAEHNANWYYDSEAHRRIYTTLSFDDQFEPMPGKNFGLGENDVVFYII